MAATAVAAMLVIPSARNMAQTFRVVRRHHRCNNNHRNHHHDINSNAIINSNSVSRTVEEIQKLSREDALDLFVRHLGAHLRRLALQDWLGTAGWEGRTRARAVGRAVVGVGRAGST